MQSQGGVFEVEDRGTLIFSKKALNRFPSEGEVEEIIAGVESGMTLQSAQAKAAERAPKSISFVDWLVSFLKRRADAKR